MEVSTASESERGDSGVFGMAMHPSYLLVSFYNFFRDKNVETLIKLLRCYSTGHAKEGKNNRVSNIEKAPDGLAAFLKTYIYIFFTRLQMP